MSENIIDAIEEYRANLMKRITDFDKERPALTATITDICYVRCEVLALSSLILLLAETSAQTPPSTEQESPDNA